MKKTNAKNSKLMNEAARALGRLGGSAGTEAQTIARRQNAQFAGRPRRVCTECGEPVVGGHVDRALDDSCGAHGWRWQKRTDKSAPPAPPMSVMLVREALDALNNLNTEVDVRDWTKAARRFLRKR